MPVARLSCLYRHTECISRAEKAVLTSGSRGNVRASLCQDAHGRTCTQRNMRLSIGSLTTSTTDNPLIPAVGTKPPPRQLSHPQRSSSLTAVWLPRRGIGQPGCRAQCPRWLGGPSLDRGRPRVADFELQGRRVAIGGQPGMVGTSGRASITELPAPNQLNIAPRFACFSASHMMRRGAGLRMGRPWEV